jgi:hypothetical protein
MLQLIDDQTASNYYNEIDTATGDDLQSKTVALEAWANNKKAERTRQEWDHVSKVFTDFDNYSAAEGLNDFDEESRYQYANRKFIANQTGDTPENQMFVYPSKRDEVTDKMFGKTGLSEKESFDLFKGSIESRNASEEALRELPGVLAQGVLKRAGEGKPFDEVDSWFAFSDWKDRHADKLASMPKGWETAMLDSAVKLHARTEQLMDDVAPESKRAMDTLMKFTRPEDAANLPEADRADVENLAKDFAKLTPEKREGIYATLSYAAEAGGAGLGKGFWEKVGEGMARGGGNIYDDAAMTAQDRQARQNISFFQDLIDKPKAEPDTMQTADSIQMQRDMAQKGLEENKQRLGELRVMREIRDLAQGRIDPIKTEMDGVLGQVVQGAYDFSQSAAYTGMAMVPYVGLPAVMGALANSNYLRMLDQYPDMDADAAFDLSLAIAGPQAVIERFQGGLLLGKLPFLGKAMKKLTDVRVPLPARIGLGYGAVVGLETGTELIQEAMPVVADQLAAAVREDMPEFDAGKAWGEYREQAPKIFYSMLWGGLMGGGAVGVRELERSGVYMRDVQELEMHGITGEAAQNIAAEQDPDAATTMFRESWDKRSPEDIQAGIAKRAAMLDAAQATQANPDFPTRRIEENPDGTLTHIIEQNGQAIYSTTDPAAADLALVKLTRQVVSNDLRSDRFIVSEVLDQWTSEDPTNVAIDSKGITAQQKLEKLQSTGNVAQIEELHRRIATSEYRNTPYDEINILGEATVEDLGEMVFRGVVTLNENSRPEDAREEIHHVAVRKALMKGSVALDTLRGWLDATETALPDKFPGLIRENENDIVESLARVQRAYEDGTINAEEETRLPASFVDYIKRMLKAFKEVLQRAVALRSAFKDGILPAGYETFLADSVGLNQQARVDTARERVSNEVLTDTNYSIGTNPFPMEQKGKWWANEDFEQRGGRISTMSPDQFLSQVRPLEVDDASRDNIEDLKNMMQSGRKLDPLAIYADGKEDGRHRAIAAKELGMDTLPVLDFRANKPEPKGNDFSIGSRASAVSTDTPSIRASNATITGPANYSIGAFHGTPHKVDKFSTSKIGTGEGAQAYGWGLYFAENRSAAKTYVDVGIGNRTLSEQSAARQIFDYKRMNGDLKEGRDLWIMNQGAENRQAAIAIWNRVSRNPEAFRTGNLYTVELDAEPEDLLDWDKPLSEQSPKVQAAIKKVITDPTGQRAFGASGKLIYENLLREVRIDGSTPPKKASEKLASLGIKGIRYLDGGSRSEGQGTYNYVAFDENLIKITEENGNRIPASQALAAPSPGATNYSIGVDSNDSLDYRIADGGSAITASQKIARDLGASSRAIQEAQPGTSSRDADLKAVRESASIPWYDIGALEAPATVASEHQIWFKEGKVFKATAYGKFGHSIEKGPGNALPLEYLRRIAATNEAFDDSARIVGKFEDKDGNLGLIHVQDFIPENPENPTQPTPKQIIQFLESRGFFPAEGRPTNYEVWINPDLGIEVTDLHPGNLIVDATGKLVPIDVIANKYDSTKGVSYSIASQSEIDRVNRALGGMNRGPDERLKVYQRAKAKFSKLMAWNSDELAAMADTGSDESQIRRTQILQALGELDGILSVLPPEVRGRVGGYTKLAGIAPMDVLKDGVKVSEVSGMNGAIISAWMREGQNIGQAGKQVSLPPGYTATENLSTKRADKAIADFFRERIKRIDTELEKVLVREYTEAITKAVKQSRPKAGDNGVRKSTLGAETQKFADMVQRATLLDDEATPKRMAEIEAALTMPDATAEDVSALSEEWSILNTFGDLDNRSSETLAQGLDWLKGQLQMGREAWRIKEQARIDEQRARARQTIEWLGKGTAKKRNATKTKSELASDLANHYLLSHANFEQFVTAVFPPEIAARWAEKLRKADEASQTAEIRDRKGILDAVRAGAKAANMSTADALLWLKADQKNAVAYLEGRMVKDERIAIDLAQKIVTGEADRSNLSDADVETLRAELAALPADTQKEFVTIKRVIFRGKEDRLHMSRGKAIQYLLSWNQPDVQIKMRKEGWTDESAADLKALVNDPVSREVMAYAKELYGKGAGIVNPVYSRMFGMNMPQVKNYAPTRFLNAKDSKDIGLDGSAAATGTTPGFAKSRVTHSAKIAPEDALTVMQGHIAQQAHWVHFAELAREFRAILSNPEVRESIKQTQGESVLKDAELWADQMEQRGGNKARESTWMNTILGTVLSGKAISSLGFNLKTLAMQLENTIRFGLALDMKQIVSALSNPAVIIEDIQTVWESNAIQNRLQGGATAEARFLFSRYAGKPNFAAKIAEASMTPINWLDSAGTSISSAIVYRANLNDALASGMPENLAKQAALNAASEAIYRFAQPVSFGQKSIMENNGNVLAKTFFLFMSDPRLKTAILADAARGLATGRGNTSEHIRRIVTVELMAVLSHVISSAFRDAFSDDDDEEIWNLGGFAKAILLAPLQGFFFAGAVGELAISKLTGQKFFSSTQNPLVTSMEQAIRAGTNMEDAINFDDPEAMFKEWNNIFRSMAVTPTMAAPAVLLNMVKPVVGLYQNATTED